METDRGPSTFQLNSEDDVRRIEPDQASIVDSHGVRYLIRDVRRLDATSRRILDHFSVIEDAAGGKCTNSY